MEFKHIEYFIETCGHRSMSQAAEALFISQQALSRCIQNLEAELGCTLFRRTSKGIRLTDEGAYLYNEFAPILRSYRDALDSVTEYLSHRPQILSFACAPLIFGILDTELLFDYQKEHPNITLERLEMPDLEVDRYISADPGHFGLQAISEHQHGKRFGFIPLKTFPLRLYVHKDNPLAKQKQVRFSQLRDETFLAMERQSHYHSNLKEHADKWGFKPRITYESADITEIYKLVNRGKGVFLAIDSPTVEERFPNIRVIPFAEETLTWCIAFVFQSYDRLSAQAKQFIEYVVKQTNEKDSLRNP